MLNLLTAKYTVGVDFRVDVKLDSHFIIGLNFKYSMYALPEIEFCKVYKHVYLKYILR